MGYGKSEMRKVAEGQLRKDCRPAEGAVVLFYKQ